MFKRNHVNDAILLYDGDLLTWFQLQFLSDPLGYDNLVFRRDCDASHGLSSYDDASIDIRLVLRNDEESGQLTDDNDCGAYLYRHLTAVV